jgi:hypothetical protein
LKKRKFNSGSIFKGSNRSSRIPIRWQNKVRREVRRLMEGGGEMQPREVREGRRREGIWSKARLGQRREVKLVREEREEGEGMVWRLREVRKVREGRT